LSIHLYIQQIIAAKEETIKVLKSEVESKDRIIMQVTERSREQSIIIQSLQDKLAKQLPATTTVNPIEEKLPKHLPFKRNRPKRVMIRQTTCI
jgi:hypothetical protein